MLSVVKEERGAGGKLSLGTSRCPAMDFLCGLGLSGQGRDRSRRGDCLTGLLRCRSLCSGKYRTPWCLSEIARLCVGEEGAVVVVVFSVK